MKCPKCGSRMDVHHRHTKHKKSKYHHIYFKCPKCGKIFEMPSKG